MKALSRSTSHLLLTPSVALLAVLALRLGLQKQATPKRGPKRKSEPLPLESR